MTTADFDPLSLLTQAFCEDPQELGRFVPVSAGDLPHAERALLCRARHMTQMLQERHCAMLEVDLRAEREIGSWYLREVLLRRRVDRAVAEYAILAADLAALPACLAAAVKAAQRPFGQLIRERAHETSVRVEALLRVAAGPRLCAALGCAPGGRLYGRHAAIAVDGVRAVEVLEIPLLHHRVG